MGGRGGRYPYYTALLDTGMIDLDMKDACGQTPRTRAAGCGDEKIIELFLSLEQRVHESA
jgi:hypothetical protein